jgi:hypothetical protein
MPNPHEESDPRFRDIEACLGGLGKADRTEVVMHLSSFLSMQQGNYRSPDEAAQGLARRLGHFGFRIVRL